MLLTSVVGFRCVVSAGVRPVVAAFFGVSIALVLSACAEMPAVGPTAGEVENNGVSPSAAPFVIVDVDKNVVQTLNRVKPSDFAAHFESRAPAPVLRIVVGDTVQINVIEQSPGPFSQSAAPAAGQATGNGLAATPLILQPVQVGSDGKIAVPFIDRVTAAGQTTESLRAEIQRKLENKAIFPQVQVSIVNATGASGNSATVGGEVNRAGVFPLPPSGSRLLDLIAEAGGGKFPAYETTVYLTRRGQRHQASLQHVIENPKENVFIYPQDSVYLERFARTFSVLGASSKVGRYGFETAHVNLAEAVAIGGGFADTTADPAGVFVFRYEPSSLVTAAKADAAINDDGVTPVLYRVNLRDGNGYFLSTKFEIQDKDIVLLANSEGAQLQKLLNLVQTAANIGLTAKTISQPFSSVVVSSQPNLTSTGN